MQNYTSLPPDGPKHAHYALRRTLVPWDFENQLKELLVFCRRACLDKDFITFNVSGAKNLSNSPEILEWEGTWKRLPGRTIERTDSCLRITSPVPVGFRCPFVVRIRL